jgi:hypothetical protein
MRAIMSDSIIHLLLLVISAVVIFTFLSALPLRTSTFTSDAPCQGISWLGKIQQRFVGISISEGAIDAFGRDTTELCPAKHVVISERSSDPAIVRTVAEQMALCHRNYGEGDLDLFAQGRGQKTLYCVVCAHVDFPEGATGEVNGLSEFLTMNKVPGRDETYAAYIGSLDDEGFESVTLPEFPLDRSTDYGVIYFYGKQTDWFRNKLEAVAAVGSTSASVVVVGTVARLVVGTHPVGMLVLGVQAVRAISTAAAVGSVAAGTAGAIAPTGSEYVGATVLVPWDRETFGENNLKCDRIEGVP